MRVCMLSRDFLPNIGGITSHIYELSKALVSLGHQVHIVKGEYGRGAGIQISEMEGMVIHRVFGQGLPRKVRYVDLTCRVRKYLRGLLEKEKIAVVHWHLLYSGSLETKGLSKRVPLIFTNHSSLYLKLITKPWSRKWVRWLIQHADHIIATSDDRAAKTAMIGYPASQVTYIPNGVDCRKFSPNVHGQSIRSNLGLAQDDILLLCPGRLVPEKGVLYLVQAVPAIIRGMNKQRKMRVLLVGSGNPSEISRITTQIRQDGTERIVVLKGVVPNAEMPELYAAANVVVLPSLSEAVSIAALEAMASGKPVIATNVGGLPTIVKSGETGILVPPRDPYSLAQAILELIEQPGARLRLGRAARRLVEQRFSWSVIAERTLEIYRRVLASHHTSKL